MMASRLAACEPCRKSKLACDHKQPVCARCRSNSKSSLCIYRTAPFKRRKTDSGIPVDRVSSNRTHSPNSTTPTPSPAGTVSNRYPNPGYLGSSSHVAIFSHIPPAGDPDSIVALNGGTAPATSPRPHPDDDLLIQRGADAVKHLFSLFPLQSMKELVNLWRARGTNLALSGAIVDHCIDGIDIPTSISEHENWHLIYARYLAANSARPLTFSPTSTFADYCNQLVDGNMRWETLGFIVSAAIRATMDIAFFPSLYSNEETKYTLRRLCTRVADYAVEITISLDCLNDLQIFLQYENFIVHSHVDGDHSYYSWRKLGDVISSIYALGYHENLEEKPGAPRFLTELRKAAFARAFSGDKNVAVFVGRPPRMNQQFCYFQIPSSPSPTDPWLLSSSTTNTGLEWSPDARACYMADTRWTAICSSLMEDILNVQKDRASDADTIYRKVTEIQCKAEGYYLELPPHFRLQGSLKECTQDPFERDFLAATRLHYLHVLFLLSLLLLSTPTEPEPAIVEVAEEMLSIVVEMILLRDQLTNSGTCLLWKVAYHGLPAAGILLLAMLNQRVSPTSSTTAPTAPTAPTTTTTATSHVRPRTLQHLTILAAELQAGSIVRQKEPNYELMSKAMQTIQSFLDSVSLQYVQPVAAPVFVPGEQQQQQQQVGGGNGGGGWSGFLSGQSPLDFEIGFWESLAGHPLLNFQGGMLGE